MKIPITLEFVKDVSECEEFWKIHKSRFLADIWKASTNTLSECVDYDYIRIKRRKQMCVCACTQT